MAAQWIASTNLIAVGPDGERSSVQFRIAAPVQLSPEEWECAVALDGLLADPPSIFGVDSMQALSLAWRFAKNILERFEASGGHLEDPTGDQFVLAAYVGPGAPRDTLNDGNEGV
jgi:uncharacterized protein DUF6968